MRKGLFRRIIAVICSATLTMSCLAACNPSDNSKSESVVKVSQSDIYFGTLMTITLYGEENATNRLIEKAFNEIERLENIFSAKLENSELSKLNDTALNNPVKVSDELFEVISIALKYNNLSNGALDISIGKMVNMWAIGTDDERIPTDEELMEFVGIDGCQYVIIDETNKTVELRDERVSLCLVVMALVNRILEGHAIFITSVLGAVAHNAGQILAAYFILRMSGIWAYMPFLVISGIVTGLFTGLACFFMDKYIPEDVGAR